MIPTQLFKLVICCLLFSVVLSIDIKPDNSKNLVKIKVDSKNRTYYHLKKDDVLEYNLSNKGIKKKTDKHSLKFIARTLIASNSNSNKVFGVELLVYNNVKDSDSDKISLVLEESRTLMYDKRGSDATSDTKPGWNYTKAGFWFEELNNLNKTIKIKLIDGSPSVELKLIIDEISLRTSEAELSPITVNDEYIVKYKENLDSEYKKSNNWYFLVEGEPLQYKISGPKIVRFVTRVNISDSESQDDYSFILRENGKFISNYSYETTLSGNGAIVGDENNSVSGYKSSFYNIPKGIHYYTFFNDDNDEGIYLKIEEYENK